MSLVHASTLLSRFLSRPPRESSYGLYLTTWLLGPPAGNERCRRSPSHPGRRLCVPDRQYTTIAIVAVVPFLAARLYPTLDWGAAVGFLIGAVFPAAAGFIGMNVAVRSTCAPPKLRTTASGRPRRVPAARSRVCSSSASAPRLAGYYWFLVRLARRHVIGHQPPRRPRVRRSLISIFARLGGGIYTKAADVGADLVGRSRRTSRRRPRNPAVIADNVGDNVGDCAGMAAEIFETTT